MLVGDLVGEVHEAQMQRLEAVEEAMALWALLEKTHLYRRGLLVDSPDKSTE